METEPQRQRTILIVDDNPYLQESLGELLQEAGYDVATADDGREALSYLLLNPPPSLILLDIMMPEMNGWEFLRRLKRNPAYASIPVALLSAVTDRPRTPSRDVIAQLIKPIDPDELLHVLARHCA